MYKSLPFEYMTDLDRKKHVSLFLDTCLYVLTLYFHRYTEVI